MVQKIVKYALPIAAALYLLAWGCMEIAFSAPLTAQSNSYGVKCSWNPNSESDLAGYKIYYSTTSGNYTDTTDIGNVTSYYIDELQGGLTYYFAVTAYDTAGNESGFSVEASIFLPERDTTPPTAPGGLKLELIIVLGSLGFLALLIFLFMVSRRKTLHAAESKRCRLN